MSRSEMSLLLPSPPTALQVMTADIENGIVESKILVNFFAACCKRGGWALQVADGGWLFLLVHCNSSSAFNDSFTIVQVASIAQLPMWSAAHFLLLDGQSFSEGVEGVPASIYE